MIPAGIDTSFIPRPHLGDVPYGGAGIFGCKVPKTVALTYDDGPNVFTEGLLDLLDAYQAKATFFISGANSAKGMIDDPLNPWAKIIHRIYEAGHQIASHTWTHQNLDKISPDQRRNQIVYNEMALNNILGFFPTYMRPPYSDCSVGSGCQDDMDIFGYHIVYFDVDTDDYEQDSPTKIKKSKKIFNNALHKAIQNDEPLLVIGHDVHEQTVVSLTPYMLDKLYAAGYRAVTLGECLGDPVENWYRSGALPRKVPVPSPIVPEHPTNSSGEPLKKPEGDEDKPAPIPGDEDNKSPPADKDKMPEDKPKPPTDDSKKIAPELPAVPIPGKNHEKDEAPKTPGPNPDDKTPVPPKESPPGDKTDDKGKTGDGPIDKTPEPIKTPDDSVKKPAQEPQMPMPKAPAGNDTDSKIPNPDKVPAKPNTPAQVDEPPKDGSPVVAPVKETDPVVSPIPIPPGLPDKDRSSPQQPIVEPPPDNNGGNEQSENKPAPAPVPVPPPQMDIKLPEHPKMPAEEPAAAPTTKAMKKGKKNKKPRSDKRDVSLQNSTALPQPNWNHNPVTFIAEGSTSGASSMSPKWLASLRPVFGL